MTRNHLLTAFVLASTLLVASCANTVRGVATDVKSTANAVEESVD